MVGIGFNQKYGVDSVLDLSVDTAQSALRGLDSWFDPLFQKARKAIEFVFALEEKTAQNTNKLFRPRQVFKTDSPLTAFEEAMTSELLE